MVNAQEWLEKKYPSKEEVKIIETEWEKKIIGKLVIADFTQLEKTNVSYSELVQLHLNNCPQLTELNCGYNKLTELTVINCPNLQRIYSYKNQLTNLDSNQ